MPSSVNQGQVFPYWAFVLKVFYINVYSLGDSHKCVFLIFGVQRVKPTLGD